MLSTRNVLFKRLRQARNKGIEEIQYANTYEKKPGVAVFISEKAEFKGRKAISNKDGHYIVRKQQPILQKDVTILNVYVINIRMLKYIKQKLIELLGEIGKSAIIVGNYTLYTTLLFKSLKDSKQKYILKGIKV